MMEDAVQVREKRWRVHARPRDAWYLLVTVAIVGLDQLTKQIIQDRLAYGDAWEVFPLLKIVHLTNTGAAFGILQNAGPLLVVTSIIGMAAIFVFVFNPGFAHPVTRTGLALMLGGAMGNLIDRTTSGEVVDFIKVPHWPAFNVADSGISVGVVLLVWVMLRESGTPSNREA